MRVSKKFVRLGTNADEISGSDIPANHSATNYTPANANISGHLDGIDAELANVPLGSTGDINETSFSLSQSQTNQNVTGLAFANADVRGATVEYTIVIDAASDLFEKGTLELIQRGSDWQLSREFVGDDTNIEFDVNSSGQIIYTSPSYIGFVDGTIKFRAQALGV